METQDAPKNPERLLAAAGPVFAALMVLGAAAFPAPPGGDVSPAADPTWLAGHRNAVIAQSYVRGLAALAFVVLVVAVANRIRQALPHRSALPTTALVGGLLSGGLILLAQSFSLAAAQLSSTGGTPDAIRTLGAAQDGLLDFSALPAVLLFAAVGAAAMGNNLLPRWLLGLTLVGVPLALVDAVSYDGGPFDAVGLIGLFFFLAWAVLIGLRLLKGSAPASQPAGVHSRA